MSRKGTKLLYKRTVDDPILRAVLADINKSAQTLLLATAPASSGPSIGASATPPTPTSTSSAP